MRTTSLVFLLRIAFLSVALTPLLASDCHADFYLHPWLDEHLSNQRLQTSATMNYYSTAANYDSVGALQIPADFQKYSRMGMDLHGGYGLTDRLTFFGNFSWARVQVDTDIHSGSTFGPVDQILGASYELVRAPKFNIDLQFRTDLPAYSNAVLDSNSAPWLGDGSTDMTTGAFLSVPISTNQERSIGFEGGAGYTYRSGGFSAAVPWSTFLKYDPQGRGWAMSLGMAGIYSMKNDASLLATGTSKSQGTGGSFISNAVNPMLTTISGQVGYRIDRGLEFLIGGSQAIAGQNAPSGFQFYGGLQARLGGMQIKGNPALLSPGDYGKSNQGFVNYQGVEAKVIRSNDRLNMVKLDKGSNDGIEVGQVFDIFAVRPNGTITEAVARGKISATKPDESVLNVSEYFKEVWIDEGFVARRPIE